MMLINPYRLGAAVGVGAHRYWRILFIANDGSASFDGIEEMEYRATVGGSDQTTPSGATTAATASSTINGANTPPMAFDNSGGARWLSASPGASWLAYDFGSAVSVAQVSIIGPNTTLTSSPKDFSIQYSDNNSTWTTARTITGQTGWGSGVARLFTIP